MIKKKLVGTIIAILSVFSLAVLPAMADFVSGRPLAPGETTGEPANFVDTKNLSKPAYEKTIKETYKVPMHDGAELYVEVTRPDPATYPNETFPVVMEVSPYHGTIADRDGTRIFPDPVDENGNKIGLTGYFAPRGYAVAIVDLRGTGKSQGCLDHLGNNDAKDLKAIIEWAADQEWSTGKVGLTGHSYVGSTPSVAAAQNPRGLVTIVPSAGLASMYDHQFQYGVPFNLQYIGPMIAYSQLSTDRHLLGGDYEGEEPETAACGWQKSAITAGHGQVTGQYQAWHAERDWREGATNADIPVFIVHGVNDNAARVTAAEWFFGKRFDRPDDKVWLGQWDHGSAGGACESAHPNCRFDQWQYALHAWFDKHLQGRDVETGPPVEVFLNGKKAWTSEKSWSKPTSTLKLYPNATNLSLSSKKPATSSSKSFTALPSSVGPEKGYIEFTTDAFEKDTLFVGLPKLKLNASLASSQNLNLITTLYRVDKNGKRHPMNYSAVQPQLRYSVSTPSPIVPLEKMELEPQSFTMAHHVKAGEKIVMRIGTTSPHHVSTFSEELLVTIFTGANETVFELPVIENADIYADVPLKESQLNLFGKRQ